MVMAVKHGLQWMVMNNSPSYITTNEVPDFGDDQNVKAVLQCLNLCHCISWLANEKKDHNKSI